MEMQQLLEGRTVPEALDACRSWIALLESGQVEVKTPTEQRFAGFVYGLRTAWEALDGNQLPAAPTALV